MTRLKACKGVVYEQTCQSPKWKTGTPHQPFELCWLSVQTKRGIAGAGAAPHN